MGASMGRSTSHRTKAAMPRMTRAINKMVHNVVKMAQQQPVTNPQHKLHRRGLGFEYVAGGGRSDA